MLISIEKKKGSFLHLVAEPHVGSRKDWAWTLSVGHVRSRQPSLYLGPRAPERPASNPWVHPAAEIFFPTLNLKDCKRIYMLQNVGSIKEQQKYTEFSEFCKADRITWKRFISGVEVIKGTPPVLALRLSLGLEPLKTWGKLSRLFVMYKIIHGLNDFTNTEMSCV